MPHPLVEKIVKEGLPSVDVSMLSPELKNQLLTQAGNTLMNQNKFAIAADVYAAAGNVDILRDQGSWLLAQKRFAQAALFLKHVGDVAELEELADKCVATGEFAAAKEIYAALQNEQMVAFVENNFLR